MVVCVTCKAEMKPVKNGMYVRFNTNGEHAYPADLLECPVCNNQIATTNTNAIYDEDARRNTEFDVWMDKGIK